MGTVSRELGRYGERNAELSLGRADLDPAQDRSLRITPEGMPTLAQSYRDDPRDGTADLDLYDLLKAIVERVPWRSEDERLTYQRLLEQLRELNVFGSLAASTTVRGKL